MGMRDQGAAGRTHQRPCTSQPGACDSDWSRRARQDRHGFRHSEHLRVDRVLAGATVFRALGGGGATLNIKLDGPVATEIARDGVVGGRVPHQGQRPRKVRRSRSAATCCLGAPSTLLGKPRRVPAPRQSSRHH